MKKLSTLKSARAVALQTLIRVLDDNSYSNISLNNNLIKSNLSQADQNFAARIVYGTIQEKIYLEYQLRRLIKTKLKENYLYPLLLLSAYQIFFMDSVPNRAVLNEANKLAKEFGKKHSVGYKIVNGILHSLIRQGSVLPSAKDKIDYLSVKESTPKWLVSYLISHWGEQRAAKILASINKSAKNTVRVSHLAEQKLVKENLTNLGFAPVDSEIANDELILAHGGVFKTQLFHEGKLTIQDEAASLAVSAFNFSGNEKVLDACSAPGGKTVQIAENLPQGQVTALDIHEKKLNLVLANSRRMNVASKVLVKPLDARKADTVFDKGEFAKILVDAPCSGLGLIRRKPEIRYTKTKTDLINLQRIQLEILDHISSLIAAGGELVYSTCTITKEEDEDVVKSFLETHSQFELQPFTAGKLSAPSGMLKILPDSYDSDGFFIAKFIVRG
ncbi:16S rRNA (cytosine(967)-C(5))-methyltransferase RsmB [Lactobacillus helsingborgensis]|nr:16S rRNA (cytosine(967)-C(5))-methyltransferase RsmB [Lactobacillus helsingborgensis]UZX30860.1 16S rRNA (cytosine(967)-C(5))-methyltransferase RsmB [Lactobacillus helsingborgensis]